MALTVCPAGGLPGGLPQSAPDVGESALPKFKQAEVTVTTKPCRQVPGPQGGLACLGVTRSDIGSRFVTVSGCSSVRPGLTEAVRGLVKRMLDFLLHNNET